MPDINAEDWARIEIWRELPARQRQVFSVLGPALSGKTAYLRAVRERWPSATLIDCRGMSADAVATRMREECRTAPAGRPCVLLLANVQYAGEVLTSTEPTRVAEILAPGFRRFEGRRSRERTYLAAGDGLVRADPSQRTPGTRRQRGGA